MLVIVDVDDIVGDPSKKLNNLCDACKKYTKLFVNWSIKLTNLYIQSMDCREFYYSYTYFDILFQS